MKLSKLYGCLNAEDCDSIDMQSTCLGGCTVNQNMMTENDFSSIGCDDAMSGYLITCQQK